MSNLCVYAALYIVARRGLLGRDNIGEREASLQFNSWTRLVVGILLFLLFDIIFEIYEIYAYEYVICVQNIKNN